MTEMTGSDDFRAFAEQADQLEARIADADARGEPVPPEARAILTSLRELARAVEGLRASLEERDAADEERAGEGRGPEGD
jgi:hypothetical protein